MAYASRQTQAEGMRANQLSGQDECDVEVNVMQKGQSGAFAYNWLETLLCLTCVLMKEVKEYYQQSIF